MDLALNKHEANARVIRGNYCPPKNVLFTLRCVGRIECAGFFTQGKNIKKTFVFVDLKYLFVVVNYFWKIDKIRHTPVDVP